ncbi:MAG: acyl-CoA thioesterase [Bradymonadia bacterium]
MSFERSDHVWPIRITRPILWGQMDALGHLNNTAFFVYFEESRIELFDRLSMRATKAASHIGPILASTDAQFLAAVVHPDTLTCETRVRSIGNTSFVLDHRIHSLVQGATVAVGKSAVVLYDYQNHRKVPLDVDLRRGLQRMIGGDEGDTRVD